jgi:hypothetical protein
MESLVSTLPKKWQIKSGDYKGKILTHDCLIMTITKDSARATILHKSHLNLAQKMDICPAIVYSTLD